MDKHERDFIAAADDLYAAFSHSPQTLGQREALNDFARASNAWLDHPGKLEAKQRETSK